MPTYKIAVVTDMDLGGSGYFYLTNPLLTGLSKLGYDVKVAGLAYNGAEHDFPFSIIPARELTDCNAIINNLHYVWNPDLILVAMDIPLQIQLFRQYQQYKHKYMAITPMENGPLTISWAAQMFEMDWIFFISELGKQESMKAGLTKVDHLRVGVDSTFWHPPTSEERASLRKGLGIADDEFVILTVADNQERKNLSSGMEIISRLKHSGTKVRHILVTREDSPFGWKLRDLAIKLDLNQELNIFNRGIPIKDLWGLYAVADVYLSCSKAEGYGMPIIEAMSSGLPVVATDTGALHELLDDGRGYLVPAEYTIKADVWGNSSRDFIDIELASNSILAVKEDKLITKDIVASALEYARSRTWDVAVNQLASRIEEMLDEKKA